MRDAGEMWTEKQVTWVKEERVWECEPDNYSLWANLTVGDADASASAGAMAVGGMGGRGRRRGGKVDQT
jgi:hypothetical protein